MVVKLLELAELPLLGGTHASRKPIVEVVIVTASAAVVFHLKPEEREHAHAAAA